jgi:anti-sigma B factor antagonist
MGKKESRMQRSEEPFYVRSTGELTVRALRVADAVVVEIEGAIDLETAPVVEEIVQLGGAIAPKVVVNLSGVNYLDSSALNVLIRTQNRLSQRDVSLRLVKPADPQATKVFDAGELPDDLLIVDSLQLALALDA